MDPRPGHAGRCGRRSAAAVVEDVVNAGSATRVTVAAFNDAGAPVRIAGAMLTLGSVGTSLLTDDDPAAGVLAPSELTEPFRATMCSAS